MIQLMIMPRDEENIFYDCIKINCFNSIEEALKYLRNKFSKLKIEFLSVYDTVIQLRATEESYIIQEDYIVINSYNKLYKFTKKDVKFLREKLNKVNAFLEGKIV